MKSTAATLDRGMSPGLRPGLNRDDFFVGEGVPTKCLLRKSHLGRGTSAAIQHYQLLLPSNLNLKFPIIPNVN